jgi:hypothetical protein
VVTLLATAAVLASAIQAASATEEPSVDSVIGPVNGGFEEPVVDGQIPGWTPRGGTAGGVTIVDDPVYSGSFSARLHDPEDDRSYGLLSDPFPIQAEHSYQLSLQALVEQGAPTVYVYFYDDSGAQLNVVSRHFTNQPIGEWAELTFDVTAPEGATSTAVYLYSTIARVSTFYADDVQLVHSGGPLEIEDLGTAFYSPNVRLADVDVLADGTPVGYVFSDGQPVSFNVVDLRTGDLLDSHDMTGYSIAASIEIAPDHTVYFSVRGPNDGTLWRYDPETQEVTELVRRIAGEQLLRSLVYDDGILYGSTYPNAKVYAYDTVTGDIRDYGSVVTDGSAYAWGFDLVDDRLWVGTGPTPHLMEVDPVNGSITERTLPSEVTDAADFVSRITRFDDLVVVGYSPAGAGGNTAVYDLTADEWLPGLAGSVGPWTPDAADGVVYYVSGNTILGYDLATRQTVDVGWSDGSLAAELDGTNGLALVELGTADFPGVTLVGARVDGAIWRYNLATGNGDVVHSGIPGAPATIHSIGHGGDGSIYFGAYLSAGVMARIGADGSVEQLSGPKQADSVIAHRGRTVVGTYPGAEFFVGKANEEWNWGENPAYLFDLGRGESGQDRPLALLSAGSSVAAGTIPNYGELGGALTLFHPGSGKHEIYRNVVPDQSVTALAYRNGLIYGGTSIHGGLSSEPTQTEAELFVWDSRRGELVTSSVVVPGAEVIHALAFDHAGRLWGLTDSGVLFEYDTGTHEVARSRHTQATASNVWGRLSELYMHPHNGYMYGNADGRLFRFDPDTLEFTTVLSSGARHSAVDSDGVIYFTDQTNVYRYVP